MLDIGASLSLLKDDVCHYVASDSGLSAWSGHKFVGVEGSPISILGTANIDVVLSGVHAKCNFLIADTLNTQAILGLDFLEQHHCIINTEQKVLHLYGKSIRIDQQKELPLKYSGPDVKICTVLLDKWSSCLYKNYL